VTLAMTRCIGRAGCQETPNCGRGLCVGCYSRHRQRGTLDNYPTMRERTKQARAAGQTRVIDEQRERSRSEASKQATANWRAQQQELRVELNGRLIYPRSVHGRVNTYTTLGCRGAMCYAAWCHYRVTGSTRLPEALTVDFSAEDCVLYVSDTYPDNRK
jgi:hypothetical protein